MPAELGTEKLQMVLDGAPRWGSCAQRDESRAKACRSLAVRRTWIGARRERVQMAESLDAGMENISWGCHLNRPIGAMNEGARFQSDRIETRYTPGPNLMRLFYEGSDRRTESFASV